MPNETSSNWIPTIVTVITFVLALAGQSVFIGTKFGNLETTLLFVREDVQEVKKRYNDVEQRLRDTEKEIEILKIFFSQGKK